MSIELTSTSQQNQEGTLPLHQAAAVILHKPYCTHNTNTLLPCSDSSQQIRMLMLPFSVHLAAHSYSTYQRVCGSCQPLTSTSQTDQAHALPLRQATAAVLRKLYCNHNKTTLLSCNTHSPDCSSALCYAARVPPQQCA